MIDNTVLIQSLGIIIVVGALFTLAARSAGIPSIVAYLVAGIVIGPATGLVGISEQLELISHIGIALLLFLVGLELSFSKVKDVGRVAIVAGVIQIVLTAAGGFGLARLLGFGRGESLFLAAAVTFSSTVVVVKLLGEKNELGSLYGRIALGIFLVQDLFAIVILTMLSGFDAQATASATTIAVGMVRAFGGMAILVALTLLLARFVLPRPFTWASSSPDTLFVASLAWCFLLSMAAEWMHLSLEVGAFLAGIALAQLPYNQELHRRVHPLMNFFIAVFFISLGIKMQIDPAQVNWLAAIGLAGFVMLFKPLIFIFVISRMGYSLRTSFRSGVAVAQISEFSFLLIALGMSAGLVGGEVLSLAALIGLITFALSAYVIRYDSQLFAKARSSGLLSPFTRPGDDEREATEEEPRVERAGHIIVVGMNTLGIGIATRLHERGERVLAIDRDHSRLTGFPFETMHGSVEYLSLLVEAGLPHAKLVVSAVTNEETNDLLAYRCSSYGVPSAIHTIDLSVIDNLLSASTTYLMIPKVDGIKLQTRELRKLGFIE